MKYCQFGESPVNNSDSDLGQFICTVSRLNNRALFLHANPTYFNDNNYDTSFQGCKDMQNPSTNEALIISGAPCVSYEKPIKLVTKYNNDNLIRHQSIHNAMFERK